MKKTPLFYRLLRLYVRGAMYLYCADIKIQRNEMLSVTGPLLITANHPNSFFDALVLVTHFKSPMYFLARGDVFKNTKVAKILRWLHIIPIHRITEGSENLHLNENTFEECRQIFRQNGIVLIFIEGLSLNNYELRPFKKGAARLAISSWLNEENECNLRILPIGISYNHFKGYGKKIFVEVNRLISKNDLTGIDDSGKTILSLNDTIREKLETLIVHPNKGMAQSQVKEAFAQSKNFDELKQNIATKSASTSNLIMKGFLFLPAILGMVFHAPLYFPLKTFVAEKTRGTVFFDSVLFGCFLITYPLYLLLIFVLLCAAIGSIPAIITVFALPLLARATTRYDG